MRWEIKYPFVIAECPNCRTSFTIEWITLTSAVKHCGKLTRLPEAIYEKFCEIREVRKKADQAAAKCAVRYI
jgi:hypothetical protein